jgi:hypothetical protein
LENGSDQNSGAMESARSQSEGQQPGETLMPSNEQGWHSEEKEHHKKERRYWVATTSLTLLAAGGAIAAALIAYWAYCEARRQANAAWEQVGIFRDTEQRQLRAYLHISHGPITVSDNTAGAEIYIAHSGQTPAYKIKLVGDIQVGHFPLPDAEKLNLPTGGIPIYEFGALYGTDPIEQRISMPINSNDAIEIQKRSRDRLSGGLQVFYLFGRVRYLDIFGNEWPYDFCFSFDPINDQKGSERGCEKYNRPG